MTPHEIVLPITKPETEWVRGRALQKTGGTFTHSAIQMELAMALYRWADKGGYGRVAPSWRFRVAPRSGFVRPLAPDVAYLSYDALPLHVDADAVQVPIGAPTVAVEVMCDDLAADIDDKVAIYLSAGSVAMIVVDPAPETAVVHALNGVSILRAGDMLEHPALPGFALDVGALFARAKR